jgi:transcriptional regulator with XRE-family HTH domain
MTEIAKNMRVLRKQKNISLQQLADAIGISVNTLAAYERYDSIPTLNNADTICKYFSVPVEYLLIGEKAVSDYPDPELVQLFHEMDILDKTEKDLAKRYLRKLLDNARERRELEKDGD